MIRLFLVCLTGFLLASCASDSRKPVGPPKSKHSNIPQNFPERGEGGGMMGGILNR